MQVSNLRQYSQGDYKLVGRKEPVLHQPAQPVDSLDPSLSQVLDQMNDCMRREGGVGLAAPQIGIPYRLMVINTGDGPHKLANPTITERSGHQLSLEGCLSLGGTMSVVMRSRRVKVDALDDHGQPTTVECKGFKACAFQHEIDHLDGKLMTDRALVNINTKKVLGAAAGALIGGALRGLPGAAIGGAAGVGLVWAGEKLF
ncbi:MAG: peptide deformylase [Candidatus Eremiobacteraeota bacterium]|nr:peptide deformylase [Candidatus Eremiobacteraeota bacterium]